MAIELITNRDLTQGFQVLFVYVNDVTGGIFINMFIFSIWIISVMVPYFLQRRNFGTGDFPQAMAVGGFVTLISTILMSLIEGLVNGVTIGIVISVAVISILWFLFSKGDKIA